MREDYKAAKKLADDAVKEAKRKDVSPYLPVLDELDAAKSSGSEIHLGLMELPVSRIIGNKGQGRNSAFANNFMPLLDEGTEFAVKWSALYDSFLKEGIRDAIKVYEFMNDYYVQEGNKRVSVSKYGDMEFILADVYRIMPKPDDTREYKVYAEYMDFYAATKNFYIVFSEPGEYARLADLLGQDLNGRWDENLCAELKTTFFSFCRKCRKALGITDYRTLSEAFLMYISIFPLKTLVRDSEEQIIKNIKMARAEFNAKDTVEIAYLESAPDRNEQPANPFIKLFGRRKYTAVSPLRAAFIYDTEPDDSRWTDSHEAGRLYVDEVTGDNVVTERYIGEPQEAIGRAVADKNEIIFAVSESMIPETLKAAVQNPNVKFICCSAGQKYSSVRYYHGKLYEATFLMGILAADMLLREGGEKPRRIGYLASSESELIYRDLNAFAIGVSLIDPECRVLLNYDNGTDSREKLAAQGVRYYADLDYSSRNDALKRPGLYRIGNTKDEYIGTPYFSWGKYYVQIVQSVLSGAWELGEKLKEKKAAGYWFGLSTGVVDIRVNDPDYRTDKLLAFFKNSIVNGGYDPFTGELHTDKGTIMQAETAKRVGLPIERQTMKAADIVSMNWLNDNIDEL
ncbi:BMP family ABC transporter substrate-binding protein [Ruminococcus sp.]|uniref:BMP family ABC transporter substrate-binding protein n=1 Tax=Ruminococcus sp. TaxID=41978 RepID=UPI0025F147D8|nr:BMP family ABC transporter substrate-binding protein [Ruminococcus sp.]MBQ8965545.1 BMP family ABC transporter substrate-binding protein [Ruminococcus sp.]